MYTDVVFAGTGGQGVLFMGKLLAQAAMIEGKGVTWFPYYGAERRGGISYCIVVISSEEINSPVVAYPHSVVVLEHYAWEYFHSRVKTGGFLIINQSLVRDTNGRADIEIYRFPFTQLAQQLGDFRVVNMIALGTYVEKIGLISFTTLRKELGKILKDESAFQKNLQALEMGQNLVIKGRDSL